MKLYASNKKKTARVETIINPYREIFGYSLPEDKQYWTMCATHYNENNSLLEGSELHQLLESGLISEKQFHGVDIESDIIEKNRQAIPTAKWFCQNFHRKMVQARNNGEFNPGIVNCDHIVMPKRGTIILAQLLSFLSHFDNVMLIGNLVLKARTHYSSINEMLDLLCQQPNFQKAWNTREWNIYNNEAYQYNGAGKNTTVMGSIVFYKKHNG